MEPKAMLRFWGMFVYFWFLRVSVCTHGKKILSLHTYIVNVDFLCRKIKIIFSFCKFYWSVMPHQIYLWTAWNRGWGTKNPKTQFIIKNTNKSPLLIMKVSLRVPPTEEINRFWFSKELCKNWLQVCYTMSHSVYKCNIIHALNLNFCSEN